MNTRAHLNFFVWVYHSIGPEPLRVDNDGLQLLNKHGRFVLQKQELKPNELNESLTTLAQRYPMP